MPHTHQNIVGSGKIKVFSPDAQKSRIVSINTYVDGMTRAPDFETAPALIQECVCEPGTPYIHVYRAGQHLGFGSCNEPGGLQLFQRLVGCGVDPVHAAHQAGGAFYPGMHPSALNKKKALPQ